MGTSFPVTEGETESAVRSRPYTVQGWRPTSVVTHPAMTATKPSGAAAWHSRRNSNTGSRVMGAHLADPGSNIPNRARVHARDQPSSRRSLSRDSRFAQQIAVSFCVQVGD